MARLRDMVSRVRSITNEPATRGFVTDAEIVEWMNVAQRRAYSQIIQNDTSEFEREMTVPVVAGTDEYDLLTREPLAARITLIVLDYDNYRSKLRFIRWRDVPRGELPITRDRPYHYYLRGAQLGLYPVPAAAGTLRIYYHAPPADMIEAVISAVTTSTITLAATPAFGAYSSEDDAYNGAMIRVFGVTGFERGEVSSWTAATRVMGIISGVNSPAVSVANWITGTMGIQPFAGDAHQDWYVYWAAREIYRKMRNDRGAQEMERILGPLEQMFLSTSVPRHADEPERTIYVGDGDEDLWPEW